MYLIIEDSSEDYCSFAYQTKELSETTIDRCLNIGDIQIVDMSEGSFLVDSHEGKLVFQKIVEK